MDAQSSLAYAPAVGIDFAEIKRRRIAKDLTLQQAADGAKFKSFQYWWAIENGKKPGLSVDSLAAVAGVLGCRLDDLIEKSKRGGRKGGAKN